MADGGRPPGRLLTNKRRAVRVRRDGDSVGAVMIAADQLRDSILSGLLPPATRLREMQIAAELGISRNTLREALRQLAVEGLVEQPFYRGAIVRTMNVEDIRDIYRIRMVLELDGVEASANAPRAAFARLKETHCALQEAVAAGRWRDVGTMGLHFHRAIVGLVGSRRIDDFFRVIAAQLRLAFMATADEEAFQSASWAAGDRAIYRLILAGERRQAKQALARYLTDAERAVIGLLDSP